MTKEIFNFSEEEIREIRKNAPKDPELTGERTAYFFKIAKERINDERKENTISLENV